MQGTIVKSTGSWYSVELENQQILKCRMRGKFRLNAPKTTNPVVVGDEVIVEFEADKKTGVIAEVLDRKNYIVRQAPTRKNVRHIVAANIDQAYLVVTLTHPKTSLGFVDRFLVNAEAYQIPVRILINKMDLHDKEDKKIVKMLAGIYDPLGYYTQAISANTEQNLNKLKEQMKDKINLIAGYSGAGKSTLINKLQPDLDLKTGDISSKTKKGKHITTFVEMFSLPFGGYIIDSPGMKEFKITDLKPEEVSGCFPEFRKLKDKCQFDNCFHFEEPKCAIKDAVESGRIAPNRYAHYLDILNAMQQVKEWE